MTEPSENAGSDREPSERRSGYGYSSGYTGAPPTYQEAPYVYQEAKGPCPTERYPSLRQELAQLGFQSAEIVAGRMVFPPGFESIQFMTHVRVIGHEADGDLIAPSLVRLDIYSRGYCHIVQYENWNYAKEGKPFWQLYQRGN